MHGTDHFCCSHPQGLLQDNSNLSSVLALFFRDDLLLWSARRNSANSVAALGAFQQLPSLVNQNVDKCLERVRQVAPAVGPGPDSATWRVPHRGALELVEAAMSPQLLCRQDPTWHAC